MSTTKLTLAQKVANLNTPLTWDNIQNKPPFGTEANTILEGSKFIEGLGVNGYGGTIQDPGQKVAGKCYFDINTKSLFLCKTTNNLTSPNSDYFTSFDNKSLLNKLENLFKVRGSKDCNVVYTDSIISFETWSGYVMTNRPVADNAQMGLLLTFSYGRKMQMYISSSGTYIRLNQGPENYSSWLGWMRLS